MNKKAGGSLSFSGAELAMMEDRVKSHADEIGKRPPYHLEYIRKMREKENAEHRKEINTGTNAD